MASNARTNSFSIPSALTAQSLLLSEGKAFSYSANKPLRMSFTLISKTTISVSARSLCSSKAKDDNNSADSTQICAFSVNISSDDKTEYHKVTLSIRKRLIYAVFKPLNYIII